MDFELQRFSQDGGQEPEIPDELQGLPNQELVQEIMEEESLAAAEQGEQEPAGQAKLKPEELDFWKRKAEEMEKAMYEERGKRKAMRRDYDELNRFVHRLQQERPEATAAPSGQQADPLAQVVDTAVHSRLANDPALRELHDYVRSQQEQAQVIQWAEKSQQEARQRYSDFDEVIAPVVEAAQNHPELAAYVLSQTDPAEFAYTLGIRVKFEELRQQEQQRKTAKLAEMAKHPRAMQVKGASSFASGDVDPDGMSVEEWDDLKRNNPHLIRKLLMGG